MEKIKINLCILKCTSPFKMHKIIFFPENLKKIWVSPVNLGRVRLLLTQVFFYLALLGQIRNDNEKYKTKFTLAPPKACKS